MAVVIIDGRIFFLPMIALLDYPFWSILTLEVSEMNVSFPVNRKRKPYLLIGRPNNIYIEGVVRYVYV